jgi:hypothetical protein
MWQSEMAQKGNGREETEVKRLMDIEVDGGTEKLRKCLIITDSNGRGTTGQTIKQHIPKSERKHYEIEVKTAYSLSEVLDKVSRGEIDVQGKVVVLDTLTNDILGTRGQNQATP